MRRQGRKLVGLAMMGLAAGVALAGGASAIPGELDGQFGDGRGGKVTKPAQLDDVWWRARVQLAVGPGGFVIGNGSGLVRYLPDGELDSEFGEGGLLTLEPDLGFELADLAIDPAGRIVAIGTARSSGPADGAHSTLPTVLRLLPDGSADPGFGGGDGLVQNAFGMKPGRNLRATHGLLDPSARVVLTIGAGRVRPACPREAPSHADRRVVRLTPDGARDASFGAGGVAPIGPLRRVSDLDLHPDGGPVLAGPVRGCPKEPKLAVVRLRPDGSRIRSFGERGARRMTGSVAAIAVDGEGRIVVVTQTRPGKVRDEHINKVARLTPDGGNDDTFGDGIWLYTATGPRPNWRSLTVDAQNRPILAGTLEKPPTKWRPGFHRWLQVERLRRNGTLERRFGFHGQIAFTRFDSKTNAVGSEAVIDEQGRLLVGGAAKGRAVPGVGLAAVRFHLDYRSETEPALRSSAPPAAALRPRAWRGGRP